MANQSNITDLSLTPGRVRIELLKLAGELSRAKNPRQAAEIVRLCDKWLDQRLDQTGAHKPSCRCEECLPVVARFDPAGIATEAEFGPMGTAPE